jgi:hypothetical protein
MVRLELGRDDQVLLREAAAYMSRRMRDPGDVALLGEIEDRLDALLIAATTGLPLELDRSHARVLRTALDSYAEMLSAPGSDSSNRVRVARLRRVDRAIGAGSGWRARLFGWLRR